MSEFATVSDRFATVNDLIDYLRSLPDDIKKRPVVTRNDRGEFGLIPRNSLMICVRTEPEYTDPDDIGFTHKVVRIY